MGEDHHSAVSNDLLDGHEDTVIFCVYFEASMCSCHENVVVGYVVWSGGYETQHNHQLFKVRRVVFCLSVCLFVFLCALLRGAHWYFSTWHMVVCILHHFRLIGGLHIFALHSCCFAQEALTTPSIACRRYFITSNQKCVVVTINT
jgi:hypothetical protein